MALFRSLGNLRILLPTPVNSQPLAAHRANPSPWDGRVDPNSKVMLDIPEVALATFLVLASRRDWKMVGMAVFFSRFLPLSVR